MISFGRALVGELEGSHGDRPAVIDGHGHCGGYTTLGGSTIASEAVFQATPRLAATRAIDIRSTTTCLTANMIASRDSFPFDGAAAVML